MAQVWDHFKWMDKDEIQLHIGIYEMSYVAAANGTDGPQLAG